MWNLTLHAGRCAALTAMVTLLYVSTASAEPLLERLRSDHAAMVSAEADFHSRRERGTLNGNEAADYASYVASLHRRVAEDCVALAENGLPAPADLSCPDNPAALMAPAAVDQTSEQTASEATASLDSELFAGLGDFDEMLLREQERVKAAAVQPGAGSGGAGGGGSSGEVTDSTGTSGTTDSAAGGENRYGEGAGPGSPRPGISSSAPPGTPDGSDDDVVARQLREAAEKETDPELKKKLWEEYRKYKQGTS
jgi:hypothetical protein